MCQIHQLQLKNHLTSDVKTIGTQILGIAITVSPTPKKYCHRCPWMIIDSQQNGETTYWRDCQRLNIIHEKIDDGHRGRVYDCIRLIFISHENIPVSKWWKTITRQHCLKSGTWWNTHLVSGTSTRIIG